jgi:hypothetical protein
LGVVTGVNSESSEFGGVGGDRAFPLLAVLEASLGVDSDVGISVGLMEGVNE